MVIQDVLAQLNTATGPVVKVLQRGEHVKVMVLGFKKGMILKEHKTGVSTRLVTVEGSVTYVDAGRSVTVNKFEDMDISINVLHSVEALEDSICFLIQG